SRLIPSSGQLRLYEFTPVIRGHLCHSVVPFVFNNRFLRRRGYRHRLALRESRKPTRHRRLATALELAVGIERTQSKANRLARARRQQRGETQSRLWRSVGQREGAFGSIDPVALRRPTARVAH